jgi:hypothetical protein
MYDVMVRQLCCLYQHGFPQSLTVGAVIREVSEGGYCSLSRSTAVEIRDVD